MNTTLVSQMCLFALILFSCTANADFDHAKQLQKSGEFKGALEAYDQFLAKNFAESNMIVSERFATDASKIKLISYTDSLQSFSDERYGFIDNGCLLYIAKWTAEFGILRAFDVKEPIAGKERWQVKMRGNLRLDYKALPTTTTITATDSFYFFFSDDALFMVDRNNGKILGQSAPIEPRKRTARCCESEIYLNQATKTGLIVGTYYIDLPMKKQKRFVHRFSYGSKDLPAETIYEGEWFPGKSNYSVERFRTVEKDDSVYVEDKTKKGQALCLRFSLTNCRLTSDNSNFEFGKAPESYVTEHIAGDYRFTIENELIKKFSVKSNELLWQCRLWRSPRFIGASNGNPVIYYFNERRYNCYDTAVGQKHVEKKAMAMLNKGICHIELKQYKRAIELFKKSLNIKKSLREAYYWLGICYSKIRQTDRNKLLALSSFDRYSNEPISDPERRVYVFEYLLAHGGIKNKKIYAKDNHVTVAPGCNETKQVIHYDRDDERDGYNVFLTKEKSVVNLNSNISFVDDQFMYSEGAGIISVESYNQKKARSTINLSDSHKGWTVCRKSVFTVTNRRTSSELQCYDAATALQRWSLEIPEFSKHERVLLFGGESKMLIISDNPFRIDNEMVMIDCDTQRILWRKVVAPNVINPSGRHSVDNATINNIFFDGFTVLYSGAYSKEIVLIDALTGKSHIQRASTNLVSFLEYQPKKTVLFCFMNLHCTCHRNIVKNHICFPDNVQASYLREELRHNHNAYKKMRKSKNRPLLAGSHTVTPDIRRWTPLNENELLVYYNMYGGLQLYSLKNGRINKRHYIPFRYPVSFFQSEESLFLASGSNYNSRNQDMTNIYEFENHKSVKLWMSTTRYNDPASIREKR